MQPVRGMRSFATHISHSPSPVSCKHTYCHALHSYQAFFGDRGRAADCHCGSAWSPGLDSHTNPDSADSRPARTSARTSTSDRGSYQTVVRPPADGRCINSDTCALLMKPRIPVTRDCVRDLSQFPECPTTQEIERASLLCGPWRWQRETSCLCDRAVRIWLAWISGKCALRGRSDTPGSTARIRTARPEYDVPALPRKLPGIHAEGARSGRDGLLAFLLHPSRVLFLRE